MESKPKTAMVSKEPGLLKTSSHLGPLYCLLASCGCAAVHAAKLAANIINQQHKQWASSGQGSRSPQHNCTLRSTIQLQEEHWELKHQQSSGSIYVYNAGSHRNTFHEPEGPEFGRPSIHWLHTANKASGKLSSGKSVRDIAHMSPHTVHTAHRHLYQ